MATKKLQIIGGSILQPDWDQVDPTHATYIKNKPNLPAAALSGSYNDLTDKPKIDTSISEGSNNLISSDAVYKELVKKANTIDLADVATSGNYNDLKNKPGLATESVSGIAKLYNSTGNNTDGSMTQESISMNLDNNKPHLKSISILSTSWEGSGPYTQDLRVTDITLNSKIDILASADTIANIVKGGFSITIKNDNGTVTAYAVGRKPTIDLSIVLSITEVIKEKPSDVVWGSPLVGTGASNGFMASASAPTDINYLWIDILNSNLLKYYNGAQWVPISAAWG